MTEADFEKKLAEHLTRHRIEAEQMVFEQSCHSVAEAAEAARVTPGDLIKSIGCMLDDGRFVLAIVRGTDQVSATRVGKALSTGARIATPEEVFAHTGYPCGGTPPVGVEVACLVDLRVLEMPIIYGGGGSPRALMRLTPQEMVRTNGATAARIRR